MKQDYISYIRSKVGHETIFLTYSGGILTDGKGRVLLQLRADKNSWGIIGGCMLLGMLVEINVKKIRSSHLYIL